MIVFTDRAVCYRCDPSTPRCQAIQSDAPGPLAATYRSFSPPELADSGFLMSRGGIADGGFDVLSHRARRQKIDPHLLLVRLYHLRRLIRSKGPCFKAHSGGALYLSPSAPSSCPAREADLLARSLRFCNLAVVADKHSSEIIHLSRQIQTRIDSCPVVPPLSDRVIHQACARC